MIATSSNAGNLFRCSRTFNAAVARQLSSDVGGCPHAAAAVAAAAVEPSSPAAPKLTKIPTLPYVGSLIPQHSGIPKSIRQPYTFWPEMRRRYGDFYSMGIPALAPGNDRHATVHVIHDPHEMLKVVRSGGAYPAGLLQSLWPNRRWSEENDFVIVSGNENDGGFMGQGEGWKRLRTFMQTDLLHPESARGYVPGMIKAAKMASRGAPASAHDLNSYVSRCSFDLFCSLMFGELTGTADTTSETDPENEAFVHAATLGLSTSMQMLRNPYEIVMGKLLGITTSQYRQMCDGYDQAWRIGQKKIDRFMSLKREGKLDENQMASYLARAVDRQTAPGSNVSVKEVQELGFSGLFAAVDTTSATMAWNLLHVALNPEVQDKLYHELQNNVNTIGGGTINAKILERSVSPYLHAVVRECHRMTPIGPMSVFKKVGDGGVEIHGVPLPKDSVVALCSYPLGVDPYLVDEPETFRPERWFPDAVESRRGTPSEVIDHPYFKDNFSQGARRCPGSRVASNEVLSMLSSLVLDWRVSTTLNTHKEVEYEMQTGSVPLLPAFNFDERCSN